MQLCFFPDETADNFLPLTLTRPVSDLRVGILTIREKWEKRLKPSFVSGIYEPHLQLMFGNHELNEEDCIWINSRYLPNEKLINAISDLPKQTFLLDDGNTVAAKFSSSESKAMLENRKLETTGFTKKEISFGLNSLTFLWDLLSKNSSEITADIELLKPRPIGNEKGFANYILTNEENIFVEEGAIIEAGCILMADKGSIYIGKNALIEAGSILKGPVAVCDEAIIKMRARIYDSSTIGPVCKVGGEVSKSIFHSYSNKAHDGFVGNSLIGQWCNIGADTNTSNLKNNYGKVHVQNWKTKQLFEEGVQFLGTIMGDHSKTSINTMLNSGTTCGVSSNIFSSGFPPKYIPSFCWFGGNEPQVYRFEKALEAMKAMMARRKVELSPEYEDMMRLISERKM